MKKSIVRISVGIASLCGLGYLNLTNARRREAQRRGGQFCG